jgi:hypothetical protein
MTRSRTKKRKNGEIVFRVRGRKHVEVIPEIIAVPMGIPTIVTVRLMIETVTLTVMNTIFEAVTGTGLAFPCTGINRSSISGEGKVFNIDQAQRDRLVKE